MASFNSLSHQLIDEWLKADSLDSPGDLYGPFINEVSIKMALSVVETTAPEPYDWYFYRVIQWGYKSKLLKPMLAEYPNAQLLNLNRSFVDKNIVPAFQRVLRVLDSKRPTIDMVKTEVLGVRIGYERLIIPQKTNGLPKWCLSLKEGRFAIPSHQEIKSDLTDEGIIQLLIEGNTAREIAELLNLSPRTIEHRIDKMKIRFGAKNLVHLVAKLVGSQVDQRESM